MIKNHEEEEAQAEHKKKERKKNRKKRINRSKNFDFTLFSVLLIYFCFIVYLGLICFSFSSFLRWSLLWACEKKHVRYT